MKFTKFSKYAPSLVSDPRDEMNRFVTGVSDDLKEEYHSSMLHGNMNISRLMVHARRIEEARAKRKKKICYEEGHMMEVLRRIVFKYKTILDLKSGFLIKSKPAHPKTTP